MIAVIFAKVLVYKGFNFLAVGKIKMVNWENLEIVCLINLTWNKWMVGKLTG